MTDTTALLERLRKATGPDRTLDLEIARAMVPDVIVLRRNDEDTANEPYTYWHYTASIDAALALVERILPGWGWSRSVFGYVSLYKRTSAGDWHYEVRDVEAATLPLAILIALLFAKESSE